MKYLIDVRTPEEFQEGHVSGALNLPVHDIAHGELGVLKGISKGVFIQVYCHSGARSEWAKALLMDMGFKQVENGGGMEQVVHDLLNQKPNTQ